MTTVENFLQWSTQWIIDTKKAINEMEKIRAVMYSDREKSKEVSAKLEAANIHLAQLIDLFFETLRKFYSGTADMEPKDPRIKATRGIIFAALETMQNVSFYYTGSESELFYGLQSYLLYVRNALNERWDSPTLSIIHLDVDRVIQKYLFYYNGIATIGQLRKTIDLGEKLLMIGPSRIVKIQKALLLKQMTIEEEERRITLDEKVNETLFTSPGKWKLIINQKPESYIEFNDSEIHVVSNNCSIRIFPDGRVITQLANC